jgi:hypothetical protein
MTDKTPFHTLENCEILEFVRNAEGPDVKFIPVTPAEAEYVLRAHHAGNRNIRPKRANGYARDILKGWAINGETIKFDDQGNMFDGQHRFTALSTLGHVPDLRVVFLVVAGLRPIARDTVDHGITRTHSDVLKFNGRKNPALLAAVVRKAMQYNDGDVRLHGSVVYTGPEMTEFLESHPELERSVEVAARVHGGMPCIPQSVVGVAHWAFMRVDDQTAPWFFERLRDGADLRDGDPILTLRKTLIAEKDHSRRAYQSRYFAYLIRSFNAVRKGEQLYKLTAFGRSGDMPTINI